MKKITSLKIFILALFIIFTFMYISIYDNVVYASTESIEINEINFKDESFRVYLETELEGKNQTLVGNDGVLTKEEIAQVTEIRATSKNITDLKGIEFFTSLERLVCGNNSLTTLDISKNTLLTELRCFGNKLTSLDVSKNESLKILYCNNNSLESLDVSKNTALTTLSCYSNNLTSLNLSNNLKLQTLFCKENKLTELDLSKNIQLKELNCDENKITHMDLSKNTVLTSFTAVDQELVIEIHQISMTYTMPLEFDVTKTSNVVGGTFNGNILNVAEAQTAVTYTYETGLSNKNFNVQLSVTNHHSHVYDDATHKCTCTRTSNHSFDETGVCSVCNAVEISSNVFIDDNFKNYVDENFDTVDDDVLSMDEISVIKEINVSSKDIYYLDGIEYFTNLETLDCSNNKILALDLNKNTKLTNLKCDNQNYNINIIANETITYELPNYVNEEKVTVVSGAQLNGKTMYVEDGGTSIVYTYSTGLTDMDLSVTLTIDNPHTHDFIGDHECDCGATNHTYINHECECGKTTHTYVEHECSCGANTHSFNENHKCDCGAVLINETTFPDAKFRDYLIAKYEITDKQYLSKNNIDKCSTINVPSKGITDLRGIEYFTELVYLWCENNQLTSLDLSQNKKLQTFHCYNNDLTNLNLSQNVKLATLYCYNNDLTSLDLSQNVNLTAIYCDSNYLTSLDLSQNVKLITLNCNYNNLTSLDLSQNARLATLKCKDNNLTSLDLSQNVYLTTLECEKNNLSSLDLSRNVILADPVLSNQQLTIIANKVTMTAPFPEGVDLSYDGHVISLG